MTSVADLPSVPRRCHSVQQGRGHSSNLICLDDVFQKLRKAGLTLKCHLLTTQVLCLGHIVSGEGIATDPDKIQAIKEWRPPKDLTDVRSFLGLSSYCNKLSISTCYFVFIWL